jgi:hypothetical protein
MSLHSWLGHLAFSSPRRQALRGATRNPRHWTSRPKLAVELLEDRSLLSVAPLPIPGGVLVPNPFGGPDVHFHKPGPADSATPDKIGGDPSSIDDFNGFVGVAHVQGTGTDNNGNTLLWDVDIRFMKGVYQGVDGNLHRGTFAFV